MGVMRKDMAAIPYLTEDIVIPNIVGHVCAHLLVPPLLSCFFGKPKFKGLDIF